MMPFQTLRGYYYKFNFFIIFSVLERKGNFLFFGFKISANFSQTHKDKIHEPDYRKFPVFIILKLK